MTTTITITRSTRLGYGCTSTPSGEGTGIRTPGEHTRGLTARTLLAQRDDALRSIGVVGGGGTFYREAIFVDGRRVVESYRGEAFDALAMLTTRDRPYGEREARYMVDSVTLTVADEAGRDVRRIA